MNCNEASELLGAYALDALPPDEAAAMRAHLATCAEHRAQASEMRATAGAMPALADVAAAPLALRARVLDAIAATPQDRPAVTDGALEPAAPVVFDPQRSTRPSPAETPAARRARTQWAPSRTMWGSMAAAIVVLVGGLIAWNVVLMNRVGESDADRFASAAPVVRQLDARGVDGAGTIVYFGDEGRAVILLDGVDNLDVGGRTYQMWTLAPDGTPTSAGLLRPDWSGNATAVVRVEPSAVDVFAITIEPAGGSPAPTTSPIFVAEI